MASILHVAVGMAAGRLYRPRGPVLRPMIGFSVLSMLPDLDVLAFSLGIPYHHPLGHRGVTHSVAFSVGCAVLVGIFGLFRRWPGRRMAAAVGLAFGVVLSHALLDAMTDGGLGVALWWPWETGRYFLGWRPIPVAPIGAGFLSMRGVEVMIGEAVPSLPLLLYALWPRGSDPRPDGAGGRG